MCDVLHFLEYQEKIYVLPKIVTVWYMHSQLINWMDMYINSVARTSIFHLEQVFIWSLEIYAHTYHLFNELFFPSLKCTVFLFDGLYQADHSSFK